MPPLSPLSFGRLGAKRGQALRQVASAQAGCYAMFPMFPTNMLKLFVDSGEDESYGLIELQIRIWKSGLDSEASIDLLKNPEPFSVPRMRLN
jgi:hypothetical protein